MAEQEKQYEEISPIDFEQWTESKITRLVVTMIAQKRDDLANFILSGGCNENGNDTQRSYAFHSGQVRGLNELFHIFEEAKEEAKKEAVNYDH